MAAGAAMASASLAACTSSTADVPARTNGTSTTTTVSAIAAVAPSPSTASTEPAQVVASPAPPTDDGCRLRPDGSPSVVDGYLPTRMTMPPGPANLEITVSGDRSSVCAGGTVDVTITVHNLGDLDASFTPDLFVSEELPQHMIDLGLHDPSLVIAAGSTESIVQRITVPALTLGRHAIFVFGYTASTPLDVRAPDVDGSEPSSLPVVDLARVAVGYDLPDLRGFVHTDGATAVCVGTGARSTMAEAANACAPGTSFRLLQIVGRHLHAGPETVTTLPYLAVTSSAFRVARVGTVDEQWCVAEADESAVIPGASVFACDIPDSADVDALTVTLVDAAGEEHVVGPGDGGDDPVPVRPVRITFDGGCPARVPATPGIDQVGALAANPDGLPDGAGGFVPVAGGPALLCRFSQVSRALPADGDGDADGPGTVWIDGVRRPAVGGDLAIATTIDAAAASALADAVRAIPFLPQVTHSCGGMHADVYTVIAFRVDGGARDVDLWVDGPGICSSIGTGAADQLDGSPEFGEFQTQLEELLG